MEMAKHTATAEINAKPEEIWGVVTDAKRLTDWLSPVKHVESVEPSGPLAPGSKLEVVIGNMGGRA